RRHTRSKRDWSSDVCSSDLTNLIAMRVYATSAIVITGKYAKLEKGNKATDWSPAPEDVQASLDATTKLIEDESKARAADITNTRSEERRVGKECRTRR